MKPAAWRNEEIGESKKSKCLFLHSFSEKENLHLIASKSQIGAQLKPCLKTIETVRKGWFDVNWCSFITSATKHLNGHEIKKTEYHTGTDGIRLVVNSEELHIKIRYT